MKTARMAALAAALFTLGAAMAADVWACGHGGMRGGGAAAMPRGGDPASLPQAHSDGAKLVGGYCTQCHGLPSPSLHSSEEWPQVAARMYSRMQRLALAGRVQAPSYREFSEIVGYLQTHAYDAQTPQPPAAISLLSE